MTTRYTDEEWATIITATEQNVLPALTQIPKAVPRIDSTAFAQTIDHTLLKIETTKTMVDALCNEARITGFASVCVRPTFIPQVVADMRGSTVKVCSVVGFPEGHHDLAVKIAEAEHAVKAGAHELDIVLDRAHLRFSPIPHYNNIYNDLAALRALTPHPTVLKLILETSRLSQKEIIAVCVLAGAANFDFVQTSTGFRGYGARIEDVRLMSACCQVLGEAAVGGWSGNGLAGEYSSTVDENGIAIPEYEQELGTTSGDAYNQSVRSSLTGSVSQSQRGSLDSTNGNMSKRNRVSDRPVYKLRKRKMQVKAAGGISTLDDAVAMLQAGATRLGTSGGSWILREAREKVEWGIRRSRSKSLGSTQPPSRNNSETTNERSGSGHSHNTSHGTAGSQSVRFDVPDWHNKLPHSRGETGSHSPTTSSSASESKKSRARSASDATVRSASNTTTSHKPSTSSTLSTASTDPTSTVFPPRTSSLAPNGSAHANTSPSRSAHSESEHLIQMAIEGRERRKENSPLNGGMLPVDGLGGLSMVAGVSDVDGSRGILRGNGVYLARRQSEDEDRPGLATRLFSDY